jgi:hypothetical protein
MRRPGPLRLPGRGVGPTLVRDDIFSDVRRIGAEPVLGSREHYFHFLIGYLLPIVHEVTVRGLERFGVLDCGPLMTPHLVATLERLGHRASVQPNRRIRRPIAVPAWDRDWTDGTSVRAAAERVRTAWARRPECPESDCPRSRNLILVRSPTPGYYEPGGSAEIPGYGEGRRSITNLPQVSGALGDAGIDHDLYEPGRHSLGCQIASFGRAGAVVGIRGAEWANIIWSDRSTRTLILDPDPPATLLRGFLGRLGILPGLTEVVGTRVAIDVGPVVRFLAGAPYDDPRGTRPQHPVSDAGEGAERDERHLAEDE